MSLARIKSERRERQAQRDHDRCGTASARARAALRARFGVHFTADAELFELIERARDLASQRLPNAICRVDEACAVAVRGARTEATFRRRWAPSPAAARSEQGRATPPGELPPRTPRPGTNASRAYCVSRAAKSAVATFLRVLSVRPICAIRGAVRFVAKDGRRLRGEGNSRAGSHSALGSARTGDDDNLRLKCRLTISCTPESALAPCTLSQLFGQWPAQPSASVTVRAAWRKGQECSSDLRR